MSDPSSDRPPVTVVVLNHNGREHLEPCFSSLEALDYPADRLRFHLVDNGSTDGSEEWMRVRFPQVRVTRHPVNLGFSAAVNRAVEAADTSHVAFLNNDTRVDPRWLAELVGPVARGEAACAGSHIVDWQGREDLFRGGGANFHGIGFQAGLQAAGLPGGAGGARAPVEVLFACGAAMAMERAVFLDAGGFDEDYFAFYEDVDLGWRLWILGHRVVLAPASVVFHHHSATASRVPIHRLRVLHMRNPLLTIVKNYERDNLTRVLPAALLLCIRRMALLAGLDTRDFRIEAEHEEPGPAPRGRRWWRSRRRRDPATLTVPKLALSDLVALEDVNCNLERFLKKREAIQRRRRRPDREILPLFRDPYWPAEPAHAYRRLQEVLVEWCGIGDLFPGSRAAARGADEGTGDRAD